MAEDVRIAFLGGLGEIGRNCAVFEQGGRLLILDCGVMFPDPEMPGVDLVLPDFSYLRERASAVEGIVLTHGHEDHVGGLGFLLRDLKNVPVFGSPLTLGLARARAEEDGNTREVPAVPEADGERRRWGSSRPHESHPCHPSWSRTVSSRTVLHTPQEKSSSIVGTSSFDHTPC